MKSEVPRGTGNPANSLPRGNWIKYCSGAGCPIKTPFTFTKAHIESVALEMQTARLAGNCLDHAPLCERLALQHAMRAMDRIVKRESLDKMSYETMVKNSVMRDSGNDPEQWYKKLSKGQQYLRDCVDHAANGMSFVIVLANNGLVVHHRVPKPGLIHLPNPHYFTQLQETGGALFRFDLYHSDRYTFDKLPGVERR